MKINEKNIYSRNYTHFDNIQFENLEDKKKFLELLQNCNGNLIFHLKNDDDYLCFSSLEITNLNDYLSDEENHQDENYEMLVKISDFAQKYQIDAINF